MATEEKELTHWRDAETPEQLIDYFERKKWVSVDKWTAFRWFMDEDKDGRVLVNLLNPDFFPKKEIIKRYFYNGVITKLKNQNNAKALYFYIKDEVEPELLSRAQGNYSQYTSILKLIDFLSVNDEELMFKIFDCLKPYVVYKTYFMESEFNNEDIKERIKETRPALALNGEFECFAVKLRDDIFYRRDVKLKKQFDEWSLFERLGKTKGAENSFKQLLQFDIVPRDEILKGYSGEALEGFCEHLGHYLSDERWKWFDNIVFVYNNIPEDKKWECFEYLIENKQKIANSLRYEYYEFCNNKIAEHYKLVDKGTLSPRVLAFVEPIVEARALELASKVHIETPAEVKLARKWLNQSGGLKEFFTLMGGKVVEYKDDYELIANEFLNTELSAPAFCRKYKISSLEGFKKMLNLVEQGDAEFKKKLDAKNARTQQKYIGDTKRFIEGVVCGKIGVGDMIDHFQDRNRSLAQLFEFMTSVYNNDKVNKIFAHRVICYYYDRLNSYDQSIEPENIQKMLTNKEIEFITGADALVYVKNKIDVSLWPLFYNSVVFARSGMVNLFVTKMYGSGKDKIRDRIKCYDEYFKRSLALRSTIGSVDGASIKVTSAVLKDAVNFANSHDLYKGEVTMTRIIRAIAEGKIESYGERIKKSQGTRDVVKKAKEARTMEEYFEILNSDEAEI